LHFLLQGFGGSRSQNAELALTLNGKDYVTSAGNDSVGDVVIYRDTDPIDGKVGSSRHFSADRRALTSKHRCVARREPTAVISRRRPIYRTSEIALALGAINARTCSRTCEDTFYGPQTSVRRVASEWVARNTKIEYGKMRNACRTTRVWFKPIFAMQTATAACSCYRVHPASLLSTRRGAVRPMYSAARVVPYAAATVSIGKCVYVFLAPIPSTSHWRRNRSWVELADVFEVDLESAPHVCSSAGRRPSVAAADYDRQTASL
jgi:hypothetical protein